MELTWIHNQEEGVLTCTITDDLTYQTRDGGGSLTKIFQGVTTKLNGMHEWEEEKHWISDNYSDLVGVYSPQWEITEESWQAEHPEWNEALPLFGLNEQGMYLDKLCRSSYTQEGKDMKTVWVHNRDMLEMDELGQFWRRRWCDELSTFYNVQPCCVFPHNPGRESITKEEAWEIMGLN